MKKPVVKFDELGSMGSRLFRASFEYSRSRWAGSFASHDPMSQSYRPAGRRVFTELRSDAVGAVQYFAPGGSTDSMGNLETVPSYTHNGTSYPAGRAVMGRQDDIHPYMMSVPAAQEVHAPIDLDHDWLLVGHTDEHMQFLLANNSCAWIMAIGDPIAELNLLKWARANGHGAVAAMPRPHFANDNADCLPSNSIDSVLALQCFESINRFCAERVKYNVDFIKRELEVTDEEVIHIPGLNYSAVGGFDCKRADDTILLTSGKLNRLPRKMAIIFCKERRTAVSMSQGMLRKSGARLFESGYI